MSKKFKGIKDQSLFASSVFLDTHSRLFQFLEKNNPSEYDKIMDRVYAETHIGGGTHRHFDGSHTFVGSYNEIKDSTGSVDIIEYFKSHFNELITPEGIPLLTLDKKNHEIVSHQISESLGGIISSGQIRECLRDFNSFNAGELFSASLGSIFLFLACRSGNSQAISRTTANNLCLGIATANPLMCATGLAGLGYGLYRGKIQPYELLRGATPVLSFLITYQTAHSLFKISNTGTVILSMGVSLGVDMILNHLEKQKREKILKELGKDNPHYMAILTPQILKNEFSKMTFNTNSLSLGTAI